MQTISRADASTGRRARINGPHGFTLVSVSKGRAFQRRASVAAATTSTAGGSGTAPVWVRIEPVCVKVAITRLRSSVAAMVAEPAPAAHRAPRLIFDAGAP